MNKEDYFFIGLVIGMAAFCILLYSFSKKPTSVPEQTVQRIYEEHPEELTLEFLFKEDHRFKDIGLKFCIGDDPDYVIDANPEIQKNVDRLVQAYCLNTSRLFATLCDQMKSTDHYDDNAYNVLFNIVYRQQEYLKRYASPGLKNSTATDVFRQEMELISSLPDPQNRHLLETIQEIRKSF